jgi:beta-lactamase regulating signal transducer with metallopeptidase domain
MMDWLFDTLVWTAALIALVLLLRRPVARVFGPRVAYALWALPMLRLLFPPITLPAWMAPADPEPSVPVADLVVVRPIDLPAVSTIPESPVFDWTTLIPLIVGLWLVGAAAFLLQRFKTYHQMRSDLLDDAREVGREGKIRLVESPATNAPIALGVLDRIVALPPGFMAQEDTKARDLALRHEIAHHQGNDLMVNMLVQPLFALHWFNPLGTLGWLALRRDQEAACDARVIATSKPDERATYANVIASFAAGPNVALAAPMACPVLGDKSIIHRLRSLNMNDHSTRRRIAGRGLIAAAAIALPLTASVTYAEVTAPAAPTPPQAPMAPLAPPAPPAPPAPFVQFQSATEAPDVDEDHTVERHVYVTKDFETDDEGKEIRKVIIREHEGISEEEMAEIMIEVKEGLAEADRAIAEAHKIAIETSKEAGKHHVMIEMTCDGDEAVSENTNKDGKKVVKICKSHIMASAIEGLREAREELAQDENLSAEMRERIIEQLDSQIAEWEKKES